MNNIFNSIWEFILCIPKDTWRDVLLSSVILPIVFWMFSQTQKYWVNQRPINRLFKGFRNNGEEVLIYLSELSSSIIDDTGGIILNPNPRYIAKYPMPIPTDQNSRETKYYQNIDPVWSQSDGKCSAEILNTIGKISKPRKFRIANTINDWRCHYNPIITIGFNPKTRDLLNYCSPIFFQTLNDDTCLKINGHEIKLDCSFPKDAGIIQKTQITDTESSVIILAGLGTSGTEVAGKVLSTNAHDLGRLYSNKPFCLLFSTDINISHGFYSIKGVFPKPHWSSAVLHPTTYFKWKRKKVFPTP